MASRVLVIDDSMHARHVCRLAAREVGAEVAEALSATEGVRLAEASEQAMLLVASTVPGADGLALLEHLRGRGVSAPAALIAPPLAEFDLGTLRELGVVEIVTRPVRAEVVRGLIEGAEGRRAA